MKQKKKRFFIPALLAAAILLVLLLLVTNRDNLTALWQALLHSEEELTQQLEENDKQIKDIINETPDLTIRDITDEEKQALRDGSLSPEELTDRLLGKDPPSDDVTPPATTTAAPATTAVTTVVTTATVVTTKAPVTTAATTVATTATTTTAAPVDPPEYVERLNALIARVYVLREEFTMKLEQMEKDAIWEYECMTSEQRGSIEYLIPIARGYLSRVSEMEAACDAKMDEIVAELTALLREYKKPLDLVRTVSYTYASEKSLTKAVYMAKLKERGLV